MNTDIIEGLNDEEIMSLYNDTIVDGLEDGVHTGGCGCITPSEYVVFGYFSNYGGCALLIRSIRTVSACKTWCTTYHRNFTFRAFNANCWCSKTRAVIDRADGGFSSCR